MTKICKACNREKEANNINFDKHNASTDGFRHICKECKISRKKAPTNKKEENNKRRLLAHKDQKNYTSIEHIKNGGFHWRSERHIGKKFNKATILRLIKGGIRVSQNGNPRSIIIAEIQCECGKVSEIELGRVLQKTIKYCECVNFKVPSNPKKATLRQVLSVYKYGAKQRNLEYDLEDEYAEKLMNQNCHYCGGEPENKASHFTGHIWSYNGIDRIESSIGYVKENCITCCPICNRGKMDMLYEDFTKHIKKMKRRGRKNQ